MITKSKRPSFEIVRANGKSNAQVICDFVGNRDPGTIFSYNDLGKELSSGGTKNYSRSDTQMAVRNAGPMLGRLHKRTLQNVRGIGYKLALADEHMGLAVLRHQKANRQLKRGFEILRDVRLEEIKDEQARKAHQGQLLIMSGFLHALSAHGKRISRIETLVDELISRQA